MERLADTEITLDGQTYILARELQTEPSGLTKRRWSSKRVPIASRMEDRADVRKGVVEDEYVIAWKDWSHGVAGDHSGLIGTVYQSTNVDPTNPGSLRSVGYTDSLVAGKYLESRPPKILSYAGGSFAVMGRYVMKFTTSGWTEDKDFGANIWASDAVIWNNELVVAFDPHGVEAITFTGSGLNDMTSGGVNTVGTCKAYRVKITLQATPDEFDWSNDGGSTWQGTAPITTGAIALENGVTITFAATTGHTLNDRWDWVSAPRIQKRTSTGTWSKATNLVTAIYFAIVQDKLWRAASTNAISNISNAANPFTLSLWTSAITIGDSSVPITDLNSYGNRVAVSKEDGLYLGDSKAIFPNVLPQIVSIKDSENGKNSLERGSDLFYPYKGGGLVRYTQGSVEEIGIKEQLTSVDSNSDCPGHDITALAAEGAYVWAATAPVGFPRADPSKVLKTVDNEATFTDATTNTTDNIATTALNLSSLSTAANGDYFYVGYTSVFYGVFLELMVPNANVSALSVQYWDGSTWSSPDTNNPMIDLTAVNSKTLGQSALVFWEVAIDTGGTAWATKSINGSAQLYYVRFSVSAALDVSCQIREIRILTSLLTSSIYRGRSRKLGDEQRQSIIWEPIYNVGGYITTMAVLPKTEYGFVYNRTLGCLTYRGAKTVWLSGSGAETPLDSQSGTVTFVKHNGGMPEINKQFIDLTIKGRAIDASHTIDINYKTDEAASFTSLASNVNTSPKTTTFSSVTGRSIQPQLVFDNISNDVLTEVNEVEVRFRVLPTYKSVYNTVLKVADNQFTGSGGNLPNASKQMSTLEALQGAGSVALVDPLGLAKTVTVSGVSEIEFVQKGVDYPVMLVEIVMAEV